MKEKEQSLSPSVKPFMSSKDKAVVLRYDPDIDNAPNVLAKGSGYIASKILEKAEELDIPIYKDSTLVEKLTKIDLGSNIPPELYEVVAQVLVFISDLDKLDSGKHTLRSKLENHGQRK